MAKLTFEQKELIEDVFGMGGGFLLDFNNRMFVEFMKDVVSYDVFFKYGKKSKAKVFREFCEKESEQYVGKAILLLLNYMSNKKMLSGNEKEEELRQIGIEFSGINVKENTPKTSSINATQANSFIDYQGLQDDLINIESEKSQQAKGYAFEKYLKRLFEAFQLSPKASYKTGYDQIDGSFLLNGNTVLLEAKYRNTIISKDELILFENKLKNKSPFVKGVVISYSEIDKNAISYFSNRSTRFVVVYAKELFLMCSKHENLADLLTEKYRHLDETGNICS